MPSQIFFSDIIWVLQVITYQLCNLASTVSDNPIKLVEQCYDTDLHTVLPDLSTNEKIITEQVDALVDIYYYSQNSLCKVGNLLDFDNYQKVLQFTEQSSQIKCPYNPTLMNLEAVTFIIKMILSEMIELAETASVSPQAALQLVKQCRLTTGNQISNNTNDQLECFKKIFDAIYRLDKTYGLKFQKCFDAVHEANMDKRDPITKEFLRREDGKIIKRPGWQPVNLEKVIFG